MIDFDIELIAFYAFYSFLSDVDSVRENWCESRCVGVFSIRMWLTSQDSEQMTNENKQKINKKQ